MSGYTPNNLGSTSNTPHTNTAVKSTAKATDLIDFGECKESDQVPALIPTSAGVAPAGRLQGNVNGTGAGGPLDTIGDLRSGLVPKSAGRPTVMRAKKMNHSLLDDESSGDDQFEDANQGPLI